MQLRRERNIVHMYTAGTSTSKQQWGEEKKRVMGGMCVCLVHVTQNALLFGKWGDFGWSEVCLRVKTR